MEFDCWSPELSSKNSVAAAEINGDIAGDNETKARHHGEALLKLNMLGTGGEV